MLGADQSQAIPKQGKNPAYSDWGRTDAPAPGGWYRQNTDLLRMRKTARWFSNFIALVTNQQGGPGLPGEAIATPPLPQGMTDPATFQMMNVRRYNPSGSMTSSGIPTGELGSNDLQQQAGNIGAVPPGSSQASTGFLFG